MRQHPRLIRGDDANVLWSYLALKAEVLDDTLDDREFLQIEEGRRVAFTSILSLDGPEEDRKTRSR